MAESKFDKDMELLQEKWKNFISLLRINSKEISTERMELEKSIIRIEKLKDLLEKATNDPNVLISHKPFFIGFDSSLEQKFRILEAFKSRNNLNNAVALRTAREIATNDEIRKALRSLNSSKDYSFTLDEEWKKLNGLIEGTEYDRETIVKYARRNNYSTEDIELLEWYPVFKTAKKEKISKKEKETEIIEVKEPDNKEVFKNHLTKFQQVIGNHKDLLDKYSAVFEKMSPTTREVYKSYSDMEPLEYQPENADFAFKSHYLEVIAKVIALKVFKKKSQIENTIVEIENDNYQDSDKINHLSSLINYLEFLVDELETTNEKVGDFNQRKDEFLEDQSVYFFTDSNCEPLISEDIAENGYTKSLLGIINKANNDSLSKKNITVLNLNNRAQKAIGREVYAIRNYNVIASFVKLDTDDNEIMLITTSLADPNTILEDTNKIIRKYSDQIEWQMASIARKDPTQLNIQSRILEELVPKENTEILGEESDIDGIKTR